MSHAYLTHMVATNYADKTNIFNRLCKKYLQCRLCWCRKQCTAGEPTRPYTSGIDCFGTEYGTSVESSTGEPSRPSCAATFVLVICTQEQQCTVIAVAPIMKHQISPYQAQYWLLLSVFQYRTESRNLQQIAAIFFSFMEEGSCFFQKMWLHNH